MSKHNCDNCGTGTENEPMTLCDECDDLRAQLAAVTRERDALLDERRLVALELGCGLQVPLPGRLADVAAHLVAQVRIGEARLTRERDEAQATVTRERDSWRLQRDEVHAEMERQTKLKHEERQAKLDAMRERDEAIERAHRSGLLFDDARKQTTEARADAARLREALLNAEDMLRSAAHVAGEYVTADRTVAETNWRQLRNRLMEAVVGVRAALASAPSAEPTPRDMRVAEALDLTGPLTSEVLTRLSDVQGYIRHGTVEDLAAVVAEAVKS